MMYKNLQILCYLTLNLLSQVKASDTVFIRSLPIDSSVVNISTNGQDLYIRLRSKVYQWSKNDLKYIEEGRLKYSSIQVDLNTNKSFINHSQSLGEVSEAKLKAWNKVLPGTPNAYTSDALIGDRLYICNNGIVLEYKT